MLELRCMQTYISQRASAVMGQCQRRWTFIISLICGRSCVRWENQHLVFVVPSPINHYLHVVSFSDYILYLYAIPVVIIEYNRDQNDQGAGLRQVHISRMLCIYGIGGGVHKIHNKYTFEPTFSIGTVPSTALPPSPTTVFSWPHVNNSTAHSSGGCIDSAAGWCSIRTLGYAILDLGPWRRYIFIFKKKKKN